MTNIFYNYIYFILVPIDFNGCLYDFDNLTVDSPTESFVAGNGDQKCFFDGLGLGFFLEIGFCGQYHGYSCDSEKLTSIIINRYSSILLISTRILLAATIFMALVILLIDKIVFILKRRVLI